MVELPKLIREGVTYNHKEILEILFDFSAFKDRVARKFKDLAREIEGKANEHELWVNLYLISSDYAEDSNIRARKQQQGEALAQKIS
ncbi:hypothetical protein [Desulforudis sp. 1031]|uniref:hypothetical protein n=1 Tax=unclassified Candidatus Desulforudis TaxID=2635950 RepID=UPI003CE911B9